MKRTEPQSIREVLEEAFREADLEDGLFRQRAINLWPLIVGPEMAAKTGKPFFRSNIMYIAVHNPSLRQELSMMRSSLAETINDTLKTKVIADLRFIGSNTPRQ